MRLLRILCGLLLSSVVTHATLANIATTSLRIEGAALKVITETVTTGIDLPATIQTEFGGKQNDEAAAIEGLVAIGDLTGPGLETPIQLTTAPGHKFQIPGLAQAGTYYLQNIRLLNGTEFLQYATPAAAVITVADLLRTEISVRQLSPDELRARGITVDARNFDVYEYTFTFIINGQEVRIAYPVVVDPRTHQVQPAGREQPYILPPPDLVEPPRWSPPTIIPMDFGDESDFVFGTEPKEPTVRAQGRSIPAAIVIPNSLAVLHQFFGVLVMVQNGAPEGSAARLEDIHATIRIPTALRTAGTNPQVSFGQPVPIVEPQTGVRFLVAQARGEGEWMLEGLQPGTHRIDFDIRAVLRQPGQTDLPLRATPSASIVVHDPRFNINFSHPDTVREGIEYSTYAFITNMSAAEQSITITSGVESCDVNPSANVCRLTGETTDLLTIPAGEMRLVEYRLRSGVTGQVFATAGTIGNTDNLSASVRLHMGVSDSGIPLSPATLILPHYAQYVSPGVVSANLQLFGLGYSLATAPLNAMTAKFPRVIKTDVFQRAVDVARAGQRIFITDDAPSAKRDSIAHLALDLLGNGGYELRQWDELRRQEKSGRLAGAAVARELEATGLAGGATMTSFFDDFATATAHRQGFVAALAHGAASGDRPYAISFSGRTTGRRSDVPNEAASDWIRGIPFSDVSRFNGAGETGELGLVGRWTEDLDVVVTPAEDGTFSLELLYPDATDGSLRRAHFEIPGMRGRKVTISLTRGASSLNAMGDAGIASVGTVTTVQPAPISIDGARQDLHLDEDGHKVSILFNRPVAVPDGVDLRTKFTGAIDFNRDGVVYQGPRPIAAAALQEDGRTVNLTFDHSLSRNATYTIDTGALVDPVSSQSASFAGQTIPTIDNDLPGGVIYGKVLKGDNTPLSGVDVVLRQYEPYILSADPTGAPQYDVSQSDGAFLFEWVRRQTDLGWNGAYRLEAFSTVHKTTSVEGSVRLPGKVHFVNLQYLGRGAAEGTVRYDDGEVAAGVAVVVGSTMFNQFRTTAADANGFYRVEDLPVGPLTFSARDSAGNVTYAAAEVATAGQLVTQNLSIYRQPFPGTGRVHGTVRRSDTSEPMAGVHVGVYSQGYGFVDGYTDSAGRFSFDRIPAGFVTVLAEEWSMARQSVASDFDLQPNEIKQTDLLFLIQPAMQTATLTGQVLRENPLQPGVQEKVPGALVKISGYRIVTADAEGRFVYENLPLVFSGRKITAYDPETKRVKDAVVPTLTESGPNHVGIFINAFDRGSGVIRVRLLNAGGSPVAGYRVIVPGFPPEVLSEVGNGVYELHDVPVGSPFGIWAVPVGFRPENGQPDPRPYGDQMANGKATVAFNGHIAPLTLRLPGQGTVRVRVRSQFDLIAPVGLSYSIWDEAQQKTSSFGINQSTEKNGEADAAVFTRVPALTGGYTVSSAHLQYGSASLYSILAFDGDLQTHQLQLNTLATVSGTVYAIDGVTPVAGASVTISNGRSDPGPQLTGPDGRFTFPDQPSNITVTVTAQITQSGIYRTGEASARTPVNGGAVENLSVVLRKRGFVEGLVVYKDYKHFDPDNVANNVPDDTPGDYSDNAPVPLAKFHLRELDFPRRAFGTAGTPLTADITGRFILNNVFVGSLRASAWDSGNEELRGDWSGRIDEEGQEATPRAYIPIGDGGAGALTVRVVDPNQNHAEVPNADVSLYRSGSLFDFTTTGPTGAAELTEIPVGTYSVSAYSKSLGKTSASVSVTIARDVSASVQLQLEFSGSVDGTLTDPEESDTPVPGAHVRLTGSNYSTQATTGVEGSFEFLGVREGAFRLDAKDTNTNRRASAERTLSMLDPHRTVDLELEPIETLHFAAYLPDDFGNRSNVFAPPTRVSVHQRGGDYERELHGNPLQFPGALEEAAYQIRIWQPGDQYPSIVLPGAFPKGTAADPFVYVFPAFGEVRVTVTQDGGPAAGALVTIYGPGTNVTVYTDDTGLAIARGVRLGNLNVQAQSLDQRFTGSVRTTLAQQSVPATATITLGTYAGVTGYVEAEAGGPSIGTRVVASYGTHTGEIRTDANGRYTFLGIPAPPTGTLRVNLTFVGPDDATAGAYGYKDVKAGDGVVEAPPVRLDATQPVIESILPEDGAVDVSPDASITITFSEPLDPATLTPGNLQLVAADGSGAVTCSISSHHLDGGKFAVVMKPPAAASGLPLRSNTLYRVIVTQGVQDLTGHKLPAPRAFAFTTSDYAEPRVVKVLPASPIPATTTFEFRFNEPIDPAPWATGGNGVFHLNKLLAPGGASAAVERELVARAFLDPVTNMTLFIAPDDANPILPDSFYRVSFSGVRDPQGNVLGEQTFHFSAFDEIAPHIVFVAPAAGEQLVSGAEYEIRVDLRNGSAGGSTATDVTKVEYFIVAAGGTETPFTTVTKPPFAVKVLGPEAPAGGATFTVGAQAYDTSGNQGPKSTTSWTVKPNAAPVNVVVTPLAASAYPSTQIGGIVTFDDEGSFVTVTMNFAVPRSNGSLETKNVTQSYSRLANGSWPEARFVHTLPNDAAAGESVTLTATVVDVRGLASAPATATVAIAADVVPPTIVSVTPLAGTAFFNNDTYTIEAIVSDAETGVQSVTFLVDGAVVASQTPVMGPTAGTLKFRSALVTVKSKATDANIPIVVTAKDFNGNTKSKAHEILYRGVHDPDAPLVTWLCPIDGAAIPANAPNFALKLRIEAIDEDIRSVKFRVGEDVLVDGVLASGSTTEYIATHTFTTPSDGSVLITAVVEDTVAEHTVELPVTIDVVPVDFTFTNPKAITASEAASFAGKSIALIGTNAVLAPQAPLSLANLLVLNGARVETLPTTITREFRVDITSSGVTYVDCDSRVDVNAKGYPGGWQNTSDGQNSDLRGRTVGNVPKNGFDEDYGSIFEPTELGHGGDGASSCCTTGAAGGGAVRLRGGNGDGDQSRIVLPGRILAEGGTGVGPWHPGGGGSIWIDAKNVLLGPKTRINVNGGDDEWIGDGFGGAIGGRIAVTASQKLDLGRAVVEARGGRHFGPADNDRKAGDYRPGTIYIRRPGQEQGELTVSAFDSRFPNTLHPVGRLRAGRIAAGVSTEIAANALTDTTRTFDRWMIGERLVFDGDLTRSFRVTAISADAKTLHTDPSDGSLLDVAASQTVAYAGLLAFDRVILGPRALVRFDDHLSVAGIVDDKTAIDTHATAVAVLRNAQVASTITTTPAPGSTLIRGTSLSVTHSVTAAAGIRTVTLVWSPDPAPRIDTYLDFPVTVGPKTTSLPVPAATPLGEASLLIRVNDRAGKVYDLPLRTYTIVEDAAPSIDSFSIAPSLSLHAGRDVVATVTATDDLAVKTMAFEAKLNGVSVQTQSFSMSAAEATRQFTVPVANDVAGGSTLEILVSVSDGFAGRAPTLAAQTVTILSDTNAPQLTMLGPAAGTIYRETIDKIEIRATAIDAEVAVREVVAQVSEMATPTPLARVGSTSEWRAEIAAPPVDGTVDVQREITVTARDYAGNETVSTPVPVTIRPVLDANAPILKWSCAGPGAIFPPGYSVKVRIFATPPKPPSDPSYDPVQSVEMLLNDATPLTVASPAANQYEATFAIPADAADGTMVQVRTIARSAGGAASDLVTTFSVAVPTVPAITANTTIDTNTTTYENQTVVIQSGTVTIRGPHTFDRLMVLGGSVVTPTLERLEITTTRDFYVGCSASIALSGRGFPQNSTYEGALAGNYSGGSHIGQGGLHSDPIGVAYGSVYRPLEHGGGGHFGGVGGGVVKIEAGSVVLDGTINASGIESGSGIGGGGGAVWIRTGRISGNGTIDASGGMAYYGSGGGGAVAVYYTDPDSELPPIAAKSGPTRQQSRFGGAGSIYIHRPESTYGDLTIDNSGYAVTSSEATVLPSLGKGSAQAGTAGVTVETARTTNIPPYFVGHWVELSDPDGTLKGSWRIAAVSGKSFALEGEGVSVAPGDLWQGVYRFDNVATRGIKLQSADPIRVGGAQLVQGDLETESIEAGSLRLAAGANVLHIQGRTLSLDVAGELRIDSGATIDVRGLGFPQTTTYEGGLAGNNSGGSHIGQGGLWGSPVGVTYGSVYRPREHGGGGTFGGVGGGVVKIEAGSVVLDGTINVNGIGSGSSVGGGGGSVWIRTGRISGNGTIDASGGAAHYGSGGGGAVAVYYTDRDSELPAMAAKSGPTHQRSLFGGAGSIYVYGPDATYGDLTIDHTNFALANSQSTVLPPLGSGAVLSVTGDGIVSTDRTSIQPYFAGHWVDVYAPSGTLKGTWRIAAISGGSFTLEGAPPVAAGDSWRGVYLFDTIKLRNAKLISADEIRGTRDLDAASTMTVGTPPAFDPAKVGAIVVTSAATGDAVVGPAGTVSDPHTPIVLTARNTRTNQTFAANALADGSFRVPVSGDVGDAFTVYATDSYVLPARSMTVAVNGVLEPVNAVTTVGLQPSVVASGEVVTGTVRLLYPVTRASEGVVALTSSSPSATVPATVTVPLGGSSASFDIATTSVAADTTATITASTYGPSQSATLTLVAGTSAVTQLALEESSVEGGTAINATLVLGAPAPPGGALVLVASSNTRLATVPEVVFVPEGATSAIFTVKTYPVDASAQVTVTATYGGIVTATATVVECAQLTSVIPPPASTALGTTWLDDTLPAGATQSGDGVLDSTQFASGSLAVHLSGAEEGIRTFAFTGGAPLTVGPNDNLVVHALVNPCDPPRQLLIGWKGSAEYRASWGEGRLEVTTPHRNMGTVPHGGEWMRLEVLARSLGITSSISITDLSIRIVDGEAWFDAIGTSACAIGAPEPPELNPHEIVWFDDELPEGAVPSVASGLWSEWAWDETLAASGSRSHVEPLRSGHHYHFFNNATERMVVGFGHMLYAYVYLDPCNPPRMLMLEWNDGVSWSHRAYWGDDLSSFGTNGAADRYRAGPLPEAGKWVRLEVPVAAVGFGSVAIQGMAFGVFDGRAWFDRSGTIARVNVARGKVATQSSVFPPDPSLSPDKLVDGDFNTTNHTESNAQAWWQVDLGASYPIETIWLYNRGANADRLSNFWVLVSDQPFVSTNLTTARTQPEVSALRHNGQAQYPLGSNQFALQAGFSVNRTGRYVRVQLEGTNYLHMREVEIWAPATAARPNLAIGGTATQPSNASTAVEARQALDGLVGLNHQSTNSQAQAWWQTDLGSVQPISSVFLHKRADSSPERLADFYLFVSDALFASNDVNATLDQAGVSAFYYSTVPSASEIPVNRTARYLRVQLTGTNLLHMSEVQVWGQQPVLRPFALPPESPPER